MSRHTFTITLVSRLKKRIFLGGNVCSEFLRLATEDLLTHQARLSNYKIYDYGVILEIDAPDELTPDQAARSVRLATSSPLRQTFQELWKMPSLWTREYRSFDGPINQDTINASEAFFDVTKTRS